MTIQEAIEARHSVRKYLDKEIPADIIAALQDKITECNNAGNLNIQLVQNETKAFTGMLSYGSFSGVKNYLVMVGKKSKDLDERVGYYGEQIVLFAQTLGLNTCWVGLSYLPHKIKSVEDVSRSAVRTLGSSKNASDITPSWFKKGVKAALLAPTAVNQQKFSFEYVGMSNNRHQVRAKKGISMIGYTQMDLGIAKYHFEIGAGKDNFIWI